MSYTVLARRYRSKDFDEIVGQESIARTLRNAIEQDRIAHAYLFCGTRGVGKTSMARIFAKALNATDDLKEKDKVAEAIMRGEDLDVIEIDGASNRGVQEAQDLIAGASLSPSRSPYKIYIIDEVHMLTTHAFNALLKTMEEPPSHVKFILATTDPHKVPATIQSRCQRFDFRPLTPQQIAAQLETILKNENVEAEPEVIAQVARLGNGSMRDALSILDRLLAVGESPLTAELLQDALGLPDQTLVNELVDAIVAADPALALQRGADLLARGSTVEQALEQLAEHFRNLMIVSTCGDDSDLLDVSIDARKRMAAQAEHFDAAGLVHLIAMCDNIARNARGSATARAMFDAAVVRLAMSEHLADIAGLLQGGGPVSEKKNVKPPRSVEQSVNTPPRRAEAVTEVKQSQLTQTKPLAVDADQPFDAQIWRSILQSDALSAGRRAKLEHFDFVSADTNKIKLRIAESGAKTSRFLLQQTDDLADLIHSVTGRRMRVEIEEPKDTASPPINANVRDELAKNPAVRDAMDLFDAHIVSVTDVGPEQQ